MRNEYSGPGEITPQLRERLRMVTRAYLATGHVGIGQERDWVRGRALDHRLGMHFGQAVRVDDVLASGEWHGVLDTIEIYIGVARDTAPRRYTEILGQIAQAFEVSGSAYYVSRTGHVALRLDQETGQRIGQAVKALSATDKACGVLQGAAAGLADRSMKPENVIRDACVALEDYLKAKTGEKDFSGGIKFLRRKKLLTATQAAVIEKLYGFRSEVFGAAHAGAARTPTETDALWFVDSVSAQILFLDKLMPK